MYLSTYVFIYLFIYLFILLLVYAFSFCVAIFSFFLPLFRLVFYSVFQANDCLLQETSVSAAENKDTGVPSANVSRVVPIPQVSDLPSGVPLSVPPEISQAASQISDAELMVHLELLTILLT